MAEKNWTDNIPKSVQESVEIQQDLRVNGEIHNKQACTAWVNFDGTTTPPTIRDSYNVSQVVRNTTGSYTLYFEEDMDNADYVINAMSDKGGDGDYNRVFNIVSDYGVPTVDSIRISHSYNNTTLINSPRCHIQIFGGKNV